MEYRAVVDRIEDGSQAVLLLGDTEPEHVVPLNSLPPGAGEGTQLYVTVEGGAISHLRLDSTGTAQTQRRIADKMDRLKRRGRRL